MAKRYIGDAVVTILYVGTSPDNRETYKGTITANGHTWKFSDLNSGVGGFQFASDSPQAFDKMASSAVSFASYYTSDNRGDDAPDWAPDEETADAIASATEWASDEDGSGEYEVRRKPSAAKETREGARMGAARRKIEIETYSMPVYWASYLINGDASGIDDDEIAQADAAIEDIGLGAPVDVGDSEFRSRGDYGRLAGDYADYSFHRYENNDEARSVHASKPRLKMGAATKETPTARSSRLDGGDAAAFRAFLENNVYIVAGDAEGSIDVDDKDPVHVAIVFDVTSYGRLPAAIYAQQNRFHGHPDAVLQAAYEILEEHNLEHYGQDGEDISTETFDGRTWKLPAKDFAAAIKNTTAEKFIDTHSRDDEDLDEAPRGVRANVRARSERYSTRQSTENALIYDVLIDRHHKIGYITGPFSYGGKRDFYRWRLDSVSPNGFPPFGLSSITGQAETKQEAFNAVIHADQARRSKNDPSSPARTARESVVRDYIATDRNDRRIAGPSRDRDAMKRAADRAGGVVKFVPSGPLPRRAPPAPSSYPMFREGASKVNFGQGDRLRIRVIGPAGQLADPPFWYTVDYPIDLEELALRFAQPIQPGMFVSISDGKLSWTFKKETHAGRTSVRRTHKLPTARYRETAREKPRKARRAPRRPDGTFAPKKKHAKKKAAKRRRR